MDLHLRAADLDTTDLEDWGRLEPPLAEPLEGELATHGLTLWEAGDEHVSTGVWQCSPGLSRWAFTDTGEFIHVVAGHMTCTNDDGTSIQVTGGSTAVFPPGWSGTWLIHETVRKVYVIFS